MNFNYKFLTSAAGIFGLLSLFAMVFCQVGNRRFIFSGDTWFIVGSCLIAQGWAQRKISSQMKNLNIAVIRSLLKGIQLETSSKKSGKEFARIEEASIKIYREAAKDMESHDEAA